MSKENVIGIARGELGVTEDPPGSNRTKYWEAYDPAFQGQPWCVCFLWWVFRQAGEAPAFFGGGADGLLHPAAAVVSGAWLHRSPGGGRSRGHPAAEFPGRDGA